MQILYIPSLFALFPFIADYRRDVVKQLFLLFRDFFQLNLVLPRPHNNEKRRNGISNCSYCNSSLYESCPYSPNKNHIDVLVSVSSAFRSPMSAVVCIPNQTDTVIDTVTTGMSGVVLPNQEVDALTVRMEVTRGKVNWLGTANCSQPKK